MAGSGLLYFTDDDIHFAPQTLQAYAEVARSTHTPSYFGGPHEVTYGASCPEWLLPYLPDSAQPRTENPVASQPKFTGFMGFNWAAYAEDLRALGGFNVNLGPGGLLNSVGDETDMQRRLSKHGCRPVFVPDAVVTHHVAVENCTPEWAVTRRYREGLWPGWTYYFDTHTSASETRESFWRYRLEAKLREAKLRAAVFFSTFSSPQKRFESRYRLAWHLGFMDGFRIAQSRLSPSNHHAEGSLLVSQSM